MRQSPSYVRPPHLSSDPLLRLTRLFVDVPLQAGQLLELPKETAAHVAKVLRARGGDPVILFNGNGEDFSGVIERVQNGRASVTLGAPRAVHNESPLDITLVQCVPRGDKMDFIVQKATELGVRRIVPVLSQRSVVRLDGAQADAKLAHWRAVAISACEQCGRARLPTVDAPQPLLNYLGVPAPAGLKRWLLEPSGPRAAAPGAVVSPGLRQAEVAVGPEGGIAADELEAFQLAGYSSTLLGPRVLRAETAAIAAIVWLQTLYGDLSANSD
jgi:16S rRNA (uracil1498-N3)-methyltransferase